MIDFDNCLNIAKSAALLAGEFLLQARGQDIKVLLNKGRDIKLQIDLDTENIQLRRNFLFFNRYLKSI